MIIQDKLYGKVRIDSPVLIELIRSKPIQRLKLISQFGLPDAYYHQKNFSRYEHSIGVMLLLKKLGAREEEQIAGLLHDVSHTAFSHVVDWIMDNGVQEDYQDNQHKKFILNSEIPSILAEHGYKASRVIDYKHFGLLERESPDLCADRADYALREFDIRTAKKCIPYIEAVDGKMIFNSLASALTFADSFLDKQSSHWGGFEAVSRYKIFADVVKRAMSEGVITESDLWRHDEYVLRKLIASGRPEILETLEILKRKSLEHLPKSRVIAHKKFRFVDPMVKSGDKLTRLSRLDANFALRIENARRENDKGIRLPLVKIR